MCGMCGFAGMGGSRELAQSMAATMTHRGPDDGGAAYLPELGVGLGFRRLAILDLSPAAHQPMASDDGQIWLVFNGEIYNHAELRAGLAARGHRFRSSGDTEVLLRLYQEEGSACVDRLNGMFGFAVVDRARNKLVLARDRLGIKPLYYLHQDGRFVFGSEIKAILASGAYQPDVDWQAFSDYLTYLYVPGPATMFRGISQVPPATVLELDLASFALNHHRYWEPAAGEPVPEAAGTTDMREQLRSCLVDAVRLQMVSDVPLGSLLSGGIDSTILTGVMAGISDRPVKTFTVVFEGAGFEYFDEGDAAARTAARFSTEHHEIPVKAGDAGELIGLLGHFDQPFGNPTFHLMHLLSTAIRAEVTVALCGAGGDELFAGYPRYRAAGLARRLRMLRGPLRAGGGWVLDRLHDDHRTMSLRRAREFLAGWEGDPAAQFVNWTYFLTEPQKRALFGPRFDAGALEPADRVVRRILAASRLDSGNRMLELDVQTFLVDNVLEYTDKMSMSVGLEARVPFLDHRLVELSMQVPFRDKLRGADAKVILKEAFSDLLPAEVQRAPKRGFNAPLGMWMRDELDSYFDEHMGRAALEREGIFRWDRLQELRQEHRAGRRDNSSELFGIMMFDAWFRSYILGDGAG